MRKTNNRLVYSTETGGTCHTCGLNLKKCRCSNTDRLSNTRSGASANNPQKKDGWVRLRRETKGRKGKGVTLVDGLPLNPKEMVALAKRLKQLCGAGGALKENVIEIQGDNRDVIEAELRKQGYKVKRAGG
ncbi:MAG: stress response translation initiation inhibitor YciH [Pseudomonadales bacterium]|nr:stress response translation initiation inhibitor YciH [Pseudomonadales bacterium]